MTPGGAWFDVGRFTKEVIPVLGTATHLSAWDERRGCARVFVAGTVAEISLTTCREMDPGDKHRDDAGEGLDG